MPPSSSSPPAFQWNLLVRSQTLSSAPHSALLTLRRMLSSSVSPDKFTFPFAATACASSRNLPLGRQVHALAIKHALYPDIFLYNTLLSMYLACGLPDDARKVFDTMPLRPNVVSWTTLVSGLARLGDLEAARRVFDAMPARNVVSWTTIITAYARAGLPDEAFQLFAMMGKEGVRPNGHTIVSLLAACTALGSLELGRRVHEFACKVGGLEGNVFVGTSLIDMYSNCGSLDDAVKVFDGMPERTVATWNAMITSLGVHGQGRKAVGLFEEMRKDGSVVPDAVTFSGVLCACVRDGLVEEGCSYFRLMSERYMIEPTASHRRYLVELLERKEMSRKESKWS